MVSPYGVTIALPRLKPWVADPKPEPCWLGFPEDMSATTRTPPPPTKKKDMWELETPLQFKRTNLMSIMTRDARKRKIIALGEINYRMELADRQCAGTRIFLGYPAIQKGGWISNKSPHGQFKWATQVLIASFTSLDLWALPFCAKIFQESAGDLILPTPKLCCDRIPQHAT